MRKYLLIAPVIFVLIIGFTVFYMSNYGLKTNKFNDLIYSKLEELNPKLKINLDQVFIKLNIVEQTVNIETLNPTLRIIEEKLLIKKITSKIKIPDLFQNKNSIENISISTEENKIEDLVNFIAIYDFNLARQIILNQIKKGTVQADLNLIFLNGSDKFSYSIKGIVKDGKIDFFNKYFLDEIFFNFEVNENKFNFNDLKFDFNKIDFYSKNINVNKLKNSYEVSGDISSNKQEIDLQNLNKIFNLNLDIINEDKVNLLSKNTFDFKINNENKIDSLNLKSNLEFDELKLKNDLKLPFYFKKGKMGILYTNENLKIDIDANHYLINEKNKNAKPGKSKISISKNRNSNILKVNANIIGEQNTINSKEINKLYGYSNNFISDQDVTFDSKNQISFEIQKNNKIENLNINSNLNINNLEILFKDQRIKKILPEYKNKIFLKDSFIDLNFNRKLNKFRISGLYSFDQDLFDKYSLNISNNMKKIKGQIDLNNTIINFDEINYKKEKNKKSNINFTVSLEEDFVLNEFNYKEKENKIFLKNLLLSKKNKIRKLDNLELNFQNNNKILNQIILSRNKDNYTLTGSKFDFSSSIKKILNGNSSNNLLKRFEKLNSTINVNIEDLFVDQKNNLSSFEGKITIVNNKVNSAKIESLLNKENNFSLNINTNSKDEKITNLFIENPEPFIKNYKFIKGFNEGKLSYGAIEKNNKTKANLKIYDFKVKEVPVLAKILTLASLQGIADLLTGEGIRFNEFEMDYESEKSLTTISEMYAIGPAISILMEGYIEKDKLTSLRGTLVPATTINKTISKIPLLGDILVGKKVGEGVFGVSFKIKGPPKDLNTSVNPIKTLTPRFITRTLEKLKKN